MSDRSTAGLRVVTQEHEPMTKERLVRLFPERKSTINQQTVDLINDAALDPSFDGYSFENTLVEFKKVLGRRSGSLKDYICAVKFVAYMESGLSDIDAYRMAFSHRELVRKAIGTSSDSSEYINLSTSVYRFKKTPMVQDIMTLADVPMYLLHQTTRYQAVGVLKDEMLNSALAKDRISAATAILKEIKEPEKIEMGLEIGLNEDSRKQIESTNNQLASIAENQRKLLLAGHSIEEIQQMHIKKVDAIDVELDEDEEEKEDVS